MTKSMQIQTVIAQREALIQQLKTLIPAEHFKKISEDLHHVCDLAWQAGRDFDAERHAYIDSIKNKDHS